MAMEQISRKTYNAAKVIIFLFFSFIVLTDCASGINIELGGGTGSNNPIPSGTPLYQGQLTALNGKSISGTVMIFTSTNNQYNFILRLDSLNAPHETGLFIKINASPNQQFNDLPLSSTSGSTNYTLTGVGNANFTSVFIYSAINSMNYASAILIH